MKKIISVNEDSVFHLHNYYGVVVIESRFGSSIRCYLTMTNYSNNKYRLCSLNALTMCNGYSFLEQDGKQTLRDAIYKLIYKYRCEVYEFDNPKELFAWVCEGYESYH